GLPRSTWGSAFAHAGLGIALIGIVCETTWNTGYTGMMKPHDTVTVAGYHVTLDDLKQRQGQNYSELAAAFTVARDGKRLNIMTPSKRSFTASGTTTTETALLTRGASQLYISIGNTSPGGTVVRIYYKPMVLFIWFGPVLMAFGGVLSLSDRRLRVGAPKPAKALRGLQAAE
ncbi:MAG: cytochrome c-type biogenesis CcmF C-terminal domain-containing protein, partial [Bradyrhizobium sp.]